MIKEYNNKIIKGAGGKKKPPVPKLLPPNSKDAKRSSQTLEVIDLLCEGPIEGIVDKSGNVLSGLNIGKGIYLNGTPVIEGNGAFNFRRLLAEYKSGENEQTQWENDSFNRVDQVREINHVLVGSWYWGETGSSTLNEDESSRDPRSSGQNFGTWRGLIDTDEFPDDADYNPNDEDSEPGIEFIHTIDNLYVNKATVNVNINSLYDTIARGSGRGKSGDMGSQVSTSMSIIYEAGYYNEDGSKSAAVISEEIEYTALISSSPYGISYDMDFDSSFDNKKKWISVKKLSFESLSPLVKRSATVAKIIETVSSPVFIYPSSAMVATRYDARTFQQLPQRTFDCKLKIIRIPSNYYPNRRGSVGSLVYDGIWDGTFKWGWTDNPAWILYDLIVNNTYGIGDFVDPSFVDIWTLYQIGRYCDAVSEGGLFEGLNIVDEGGGEFSGDTRFSCNLILSEAREAFSFLNQVSAIFRGFTYWINGGLLFSDDRPKNSLMSFNNSDVKNGEFKYSETAKNTRFTIAEIQYNDREDEYVPKIESVEDAESLARSGPIIKRVEGLGVTNKAEANRLGKYILYTSKLDTETVSFVAGQESMYLLPGDLFSVFDEIKVLKRKYGKVLGVGRDVDYNLKGIMIDSEVEGDLQSISISNPQDYSTYQDLNNFTFTGDAENQMEIINNLRAAQSAEFNLSGEALTGGVCSLELTANSANILLPTADAFSIHGVTLNKCANSVDISFDPPIFREQESGSIIGIGDSGEDITYELIRDAINNTTSTIYDVSGNELDSSSIQINVENENHIWGFATGLEFIEDNISILDINYGLIPNNASELFALSDTKGSVAIDTLKQRFYNGDYSYSIKTADLTDDEQEKKYRVVGVKEINKNEYEVVGLTYSDEKFDAIEGQYVNQKDFNYGEITSINLGIFKPSEPVITDFSITLTPINSSSSTFGYTIEWDWSHSTDNIERFDLTVVAPDGTITEHSKFSNEYDATVVDGDTTTYQYSITYEETSDNTDYPFGSYSANLKAVSSSPYFTPSNPFVSTYVIDPPSSLIQRNNFVVKTFAASSKLAASDPYSFSDDYLIGGSGTNNLSATNLSLSWTLKDPYDININTSLQLNNNSFEPIQTLSVLDSGENATTIEEVVNGLNFNINSDNLITALSGIDNLRDYYANLTIGSNSSGINDYTAQLHIVNEKPIINSVIVEDINDGITGRVNLDITLEPKEDLSEIVVFTGDTSGFSADTSGFENAIHRSFRSYNSTSINVSLTKDDEHSTGDSGAAFEYPYTAFSTTSEENGLDLPSGYLFYKVMAIDSIGNGDVFNVGDSGILLVDPDDYGDYDEIEEELDAVSSGLSGHLADYNNPHQVTADQVGALSSTLKGFRAVNDSGTSQSFSINTWTKMDENLFDVIEFDSDSWFASGTFTPTEEGYYSTSAVITTSQADNTELKVGLYKNGSIHSLFGGGTIATSSSGISSFGGTDIIYLDGSGDYIETYAFSSNTSPSTSGTSGFNRFSAYKIAKD